MKLWSIIFLGVVIHLVLFYSIFDIYFTSPVVHGMAPRTARVQASAERLVLIVVDGLRADRFFELDDTGVSRSPFLRTVIRERGRWGVSHTRVPTETRPGHVALIAGFYEDVSAIFKGWKENPVEFDSVFNQSRYTWSWGYPDVILMFSKGSTSHHVTADWYPAQMNDIAGSNLAELDSWVFNKVKNFFENANKNATLMAQLHQDKLIFFLHLLATDSLGHGSKPHSKEYLSNIQLVDVGLQNILSLIQEFYHYDNKTAYVLTSDHGMTDWGSHGSGHPDETMTPLVVWGAGVKPPRWTNASCGNFPDNYCYDWRLEDRERVDILQADVAPLVAFLIGAAFPVNSVGELPTGYLDGPVSFHAEGLFANAQQIVSQYQVKQRQVKEQTFAATFRPFTKLSPDVEVKSLQNIEHFISTGKHREAIHASKQLMRLSLQGLQYYHSYDAFFLCTWIALGFIGWIGYVLTIVLIDSMPITGVISSGRIGHDPQLEPAHCGKRWRRPIRLIFGTVLICTILFLYASCLPWTNYLYCLIPVYLWMKLAERLAILKSALQYLLCQRRLLFSILFCLLLLEITVLSFYYRHLLAVGLVAMAAWTVTTKLWQQETCIYSSVEQCWNSGLTIVNIAAQYSPFINCYHQVKSVCWMASCSLTAMFPSAMPVISHVKSYNVVLCSGFLAIFLGSYLLKRHCWQNGICVADLRTRRILFGQILLIVVAMAIVKAMSDRLTQKSSSLFLYHFFSWLILGVTPLLPTLTTVNIDIRLLSLNLAFFALYLLLSIFYEALFLLSLMTLLHFWLCLERILFKMDTNQLVHTFKSTDQMLIKKGIPLKLRKPDIADLRKALFFIFLIVASFFGTGNIASVSSFDLTSVFCFLTMFNPFLMGALMLLKVLLPFMLVTCTFQAIQVVTFVPLRTIVLLVLILSDIMSLNFFFLIQDSGSWQDIGMSISRYIISMSMTVFILVAIVVFCFQSTKIGK